MGETSGLIERYGEGFKLLTGAIEGLSEEELNFKPSPDKWSMKEIIIHISDAEIVGVHRIKSVIAEKEPLLTAYDQDAWADNQRYADLALQPYLDIFRLLREGLIPVLKNLPAEAWTRTGNHSEAGKLSLTDLLQRYVNHIEDHLRQIERVKEAFRNR